MDCKRSLLRLGGAALMLGSAHLACLPLPETTGTSASEGESSSVGTEGSITASSTSAGETDPGSTSGASTSSSGGSTGVGTTGSGTGEGSTTACDFICGDPPCGEGEVLVPGPEPGLAPRCLPGRCDPWAQDCPEGDKCAAYSEGGATWDELSCAPILGDAEPGEPCVVSEDPLSGLDTCELGAMCWGVDEESLEGVCVGLCDGSSEEPTCAEPGTSCRITNDGVLNLCLADCTPLGQGCAEGEACVFVVDGFSCVPGGEQGQGEACDGSSCTSGHLCLPAPYLPECRSSSCCTPYCEAGDDPCPDLEGSTCVPFFMEGEAPEGLEELGFCAFPP